MVNFIDSKICQVGENVKNIPTQQSPSSCYNILPINTKRAEFEFYE